jgi:hypothetical protein
MKNPEGKQRTHQLKNRDILFIDLFLKTNNAYQSYQEAFGASPETAKAGSVRILKRDVIKNEIKRRQEAFERRIGMDREKLIQECIAVIEDAKGAEKVDRGSWLKAVDLLAKMIGAYAPEKIEMKTENIIKFEFDDFKEEGDEDDDKGI